MTARSSTLIGMIQTEQINTSAIAFADVSANATGNQRAEGRTIGRNAIAIADAGNITLSTNIRSESITQSSDLGTIQHTPNSNSNSNSVSSSINASARALADAIAEGGEAQSQPGNSRFEATGGDITVKAMSQIQLGANSELNASAGVFSQFDQPDTITEDAALRGGNITLRASNNILLNQISAETNSVFILDKDRDRDRVVIANVLDSSAGDLTVRTPTNIRLREGAEVSVTATGGEGTAGNMEFSSRALILGERSRILSQTESGDGGNITINTAANPSKLLLLHPHSTISTAAGTEQQGGNGGDISINSRLILTLDRYNSDITANAFEGNGGNIFITTDGLFGLEFRDEDTSQSDITATSEVGLDGTFSLNAPDIDPSQGTIDLPAAPTNPPPFNPLCVAAQSGSTFTLIGRGGLPSTPTDLHSAIAPWEDWYIATPEETDSADSSSHFNDPPATENPRKVQIIEAQGWATTTDGQLMLVAHTHTTPPSQGALPPPNCQQVSTEFIE